MTEYPASLNAALAAVLARLARDPGLSAFMRSDAAVMLIASDGAHVLHGNEPGLAMGRAGFPRKTILQFARLAGGLAPGNGVRLEQIDLPTARGMAALTCACRRIRMEDGATLLLIAAQDRQRQDEVLAAPVGEAVPEAPASLAGPHGHGASAIQPQLPVNVPVPDMISASPVAHVPGPLPDKVRFIWDMDGIGVFRPRADDIITVLGSGTAAAMAGQPWAALCGSVVDDPGNAVASALVQGKTFSALHTYWRISGTDEACKVTLSGLPLHDSTRAVAGWRGFGIIDTRQIVPFAPAQGRVDTPDPNANQREVSDLQENPADPNPADPNPTDPNPTDPNPTDPNPTDPSLTDISPAHAAMAGQAPSDEDMPELYPAQRSTESGRSEKPPEAAPLSSAPTNVVQIRPHDPALRLTSSERNAFREIAKALGAQLDGDEGPHKAAPVSAAAHAPQRKTSEATEATETTDTSGTGHDAGAAQDEASLPVALPPAVETSVAPEPSGPVLPTDQSTNQATAPQGVVHLLTAAPLRDDMFMSLLDKLPIGILVLKAERITYANRTLLDLLDHDSLDDLMDRGADRLFSGSTPSEGGGVFTLARRDGSPEAVDARLSAITWNGAPATLMSFRRAHETAHAETGDAARADALKLDLDKAQAQARELIAILDTATDGVATVDDRGRILSLNKSAEALFGYDQREVTGENFTLLLAPESHITALDYLEGLKGGGVASLLNDGREVAGRVRQGGRIPLFMTMGRVADGEDKKYSAVLRDMTAWKRAEADLVEARRQAERASAQKSDVLAKISHEIRTPLNAILGFTEVMSEERFGPIGNERYKEYLGDIHQSGGYLISLINDLLDLAKIEAGKMDLTFVGVNLNDIATSSVALLQPEANRQRVVLRTGLQPKLPAVVADDRSLRQIVINVLSNAVKFTDAGGQVIVSTALGDRGEVILRVRDTGVGMSEKELALAMEPFRQVSATRRGNGTGLGLPITKALVEANKGALLITSAKNEGTLVEITFPPQRVLAS